MNPFPESTLREHVTQAVTAVVKATADRVGETAEQGAARAQHATHAVLAFLPRDGVEAIIVGHCVMFHEIILRDVRRALSGDPDEKPHLIRKSIVAMDKAFGENLTRLARHRAGEPMPKPVAARDEAEIAERIRRHQAPAPAPDAPEPTPPAGEPAAPIPSAEQIAACRANAEAIAAIKAGDPRRFAHAMGVEQPSEAYLAAAAAQMAYFHRPRPDTPAAPAAVPYAGNRQQRRHPNR